MSLRIWIILLNICLLSTTVGLAADGEKEKPHFVPLPELKNLDTNLGTHTEIEPIGNTDEIKFGNLTTFALSPEDNILACDAKSKEIKVIDPTGKLIETWKLDFAPFVIHSCRCGEVFVAGSGIVAKLDPTGKLIKQVKAETAGFPNAKASGIAAFGQNVFVAFGTEGSLRSRSKIVRFKRDLTEPTIIAEDMRGCCRRLDMVAWEGELFVAENARHRVVKFDSTGKVLSKWGARDRVNIEGFGSCCNPMNLYYSPKGDLYTAESGLGRIKRYSPDGKFLGLVGYVGVARFQQAGRLAASCSNIAVAVNNDESRVYVLDYKDNLIRVMERKNNIKTIASEIPTRCELKEDCEKN